MDFLQEGILAHIVNNIGKMGAGIALQVAQMWPAVEQEYTNIIATTPKEQLGGKVLFVPLKRQFYVANLFAQDGLPSSTNPAPLNYEWLDQCLATLFSFANEQDLDIRMPKIGSGFARGNWNKIWSKILIQAEQAKYFAQLTIHEAR